MRDRILPQISILEIDRHLSRLSLPTKKGNTMKTTNYRLQTEIENLKPSSQKDWFKNYVREILESDKPYHVKADCRYA